jgi:hypothetical protein
MTRWYQVKGSLIGMTLSATDNEVVEAEAGQHSIHILIAPARLRASSAFLSVSTNHFNIQYLSVLLVVRCS